MTQAIAGPDDFTFWIRSAASKQFVGTAFLVSKTLLVTADHVLESVESRHLGAFFPKTSQSTEIATVFRSRHEGIDLAFIEIKRCVEGACPAILSRSRDSVGSRFVSSGWRRGAYGGAGGIILPFRYEYPGGLAKLTLSSGNIDVGMSGAAVYDLSTKSVCGMIVTKWRPPDNSNSDTDTSFAIPSEYIVEYSPTKLPVTITNRRLFTAPTEHNTRTSVRSAAIAAFFDLVVNSRFNVLSITGLSGVGKTTFAMAVASKLHREHIGFHVIWIDCDDYREVDQRSALFENILSLLGYARSGPATAALCRHSLSREPAIFFVDNASDKFMKLITALLRVIDDLSSVVIIANAPMELLTAKSFELEPLDDTQIGQLVRAELDRNGIPDGTQKHIAKIVKLSRGFPAIAVWLSAYLARYGRALFEFEFNDRALISKALSLNDAALELVAYAPSHELALIASLPSGSDIKLLRDLDESDCGVLLKQLKELEVSGLARLVMKGASRESRFFLHPIAKDVILDKFRHLSDANSTAVICKAIAHYERFSRAISVRKNGIYDINIFDIIRDDLPNILHICSLASVESADAVGKLVCNISYFLFSDGLLEFRKAIGRTAAFLSEKAGRDLDASWIWINEVAYIDWSLGDIDSARTHLARGVCLLERVEPSTGIGTNEYRRTLEIRAFVKRYNFLFNANVENVDMLIPKMVEAVNLFLEQGRLGLACNTEIELGEILLRCGRHIAAGQYFRDGIEGHWRARQSRRWCYVWISRGLWGLSQLAAENGFHTIAVRRLRGAKLAARRVKSDYLMGILDDSAVGRDDWVPRLSFKDDPMDAEVALRTQ